MRKIAVFITLFFSIGAQYFSIPSTHAWIFDEPESQIHICTNNDCTVRDWADALWNTLNWQITDRPFSEYIQEYVGYLLTFLTILAVLYVIWAGFQILTSNGDEERVKQSKSTILYVALGIIIIWLAYSIVSWIMRITTNQTAFNIFRPFQIAWIDTAHASYTENERGTFLEYKSRIRSALEELEAEMRLNKQVSVSSLNALKQLVQQASERLPDRDPKTATENQSTKRAVDLAIDLAIQKPNSTSTISTAIRDTAKYINGAKIEKITGNITATPTEGHAPLTVSFRAADIKDPSGTTPPANNHIWWIRENGGAVRILGRGPSLTQDFTQEGTFTIFLDVVSASRNSRGYTDVLPFSQSIPIEVKPKLGEVVLLINGVNVSNLESLKVSPIVASQGIILDATASRAIGNGKITETKWEFGNGNISSHKWSPVVERQIYANEGNYTVKFSFKTNDGQEFKKELQLIIRDPAALIKLDKEVAHVGESITFGSETYYGESKNIVYTWEIQDDNQKKQVKSANGNTLTHTFDATGHYLVTLHARSPNGSMDADSRRITIESREPVVALDPPRPINAELPNTFIFDASKSYNPDSNSRNNLTYIWRVNGQRVELQNSSNGGARGELTFDSIGKNTVSVTVSNDAGKVATAEQHFEVKSILSASMKISPQVAQVGNTIRFIADAPYADFFTWNMGDGTPAVSSSSRTAQHTFARSGIYTVSLTVNRGGSNEQNTVSRKVYITDMSTPLAILQASNASNSVIEEDNICNGKPAWIVNRWESTTFDAGQSVNTDGYASNLDYTWKYMGKVSTNSRISETFGDLGCFPIELTVRSKTNGAKNTTKQFIQLKNRPPELTSISTTVDSTKKDSQKVIVKATANGVTDPDGVVTSYIWYYTTESDSEPQNIQISQNPHMTFVLPNITEKYYFGVILEDNDGARVNSADIFQKSSPLIIDNAHGNIYMPLITLSTSKSTAKIGESIHFSAEAKTIIGSVVTNKSQYAWDFDGDGRIDERTSGPSIDYAYKTAGTYNMRVRVTHNGVSNTKYQTIHVRNELKAGVQAYKIPGEKLYLLNTSQWVYDTVAWNIGERTADSLYSLVLSFDEVPRAVNGVIGKMTVSHNTDFSHADILMRDIQTVTNNPDEVNFQSFPAADDTDTITISDPNQGLRLSLYGNEASNYAIDIDTDVDSGLDGSTDNDIDNKNSPSYTDGSLFVVPDFAGVRKRTRDLKITLYNGDTPIRSKTLHLVFDFIKEQTETDTPESDPFPDTLTPFDREQIDALHALIRDLPTEDRIILMKKYNLLAENWDSPFERTKILIDIQEHVTYAGTIEKHKQSAISDVIDAIIRGQAEMVDQIDLAVKLIRDLIPQESPHSVSIQEKLDAIQSHPQNTEENRRLGKEILELIQNDTTIEDKYKLLIKNQLEIIIRGGQANVSPDTTPPPKSPGSGSGILGIIGTVVKIFFIILGILLGIFLALYAYFRMTKKEGESGFQDFLIDRIFHKKPPETSREHLPTNVSEKIQVSVSETLQSPQNTTPDPLTTYIPPQESTHTWVLDTPPPTQQENIPDWLKWATSDPLSLQDTNTLTSTTSASPFEAPPTTPASSLDTPASSLETNSSIPDWLKPPANTETPSYESSIDPSSSIDSNPDAYTPPAWTPEDTTTQSNETESGYSDASLPDWLQGGISEDNSFTSDDITTSETSPSDPMMPEETIIDASYSENSSREDITPTPESTSTRVEEIPDWLLESVQDIASPDTSEASASDIASHNQEDTWPMSLSIESEWSSWDSFHTETPRDDGIGIEQVSPEKNTSISGEKRKKGTSTSQGTKKKKEQKKSNKIKTEQTQKESSQTQNTENPESHIPDWLK